MNGECCPHNRLALASGILKQMLGDDGADIGVLEPSRIACYANATEKMNDTGQHSLRQRVKTLFCPLGLRGHYLVMS